MSIPSGTVEVDSLPMAPHVNKTEPLGNASKASTLESSPLAFPLSQENTDLFTMEPWGDTLVGQAKPWTRHLGICTIHKAGQTEPHSASSLGHQGHWWQQEKCKWHGGHWAGGPLASATRVMVSLLRRKCQTKRHISRRVKEDNLASLFLPLPHLC